MLQDMFIKEDHPIVMKLTFSISLGLLPTTLSLETTGCGIKKSGLPVEESGDMDNGSKTSFRAYFCTVFFFAIDYMWQYRSII